jgi:hypothetical protein
MEIFDDALDLDNLMYLMGISQAEIFEIQMAGLLMDLIDNYNLPKI